MTSKEASMCNERQVKQEGCKEPAPRSLADELREFFSVRSQYVYRNVATFDQYEKAAERLASFLRGTEKGTIIHYDHYSLIVVNSGGQFKLLDGPEWSVSPIYKGSRPDQPQPIIKACGCGTCGV